MRQGALRVTGETIGDFLYRLPEYRKNLEEYQPSDDSEIKSKLDELLKDKCALVRKFQRRR